jgi:hypothetical protein
MSMFGIKANMVTQLKRNVVSMQVASGGAGGSDDEAADQL